MNRTIRKLIAFGMALVLPMSALAASGPNSEGKYSLDGEDINAPRWDEKGEGWYKNVSVTLTDEDGTAHEITLKVGNAYDCVELCAAGLALPYPAAGESGILLEDALRIAYTASREIYGLSLEDWTNGRVVASYESSENGFSDTSDTEACVWGLHLWNTRENQYEFYINADTGDLLDTGCTGSSNG